jgi:predicted transcriptional regulator
MSQEVIQMAAKVSVSIKIDPALKEQLETIAKREDRTLSNQVSSFAKRSVEQYLQENKLYWDGGDLIKRRA